MKIMPRRLFVNLGLIGLASFAIVGFAAAQAIGAADRVLLLQAKRFEGAYKLPTGVTSVKVGDDTADWSLASGTTSLEAALAPASGKPSRATLRVDGRTVEGKAAIEGRTLTMEFQDGKTAYKIKLVLTGRNDGDLSVTKNDTIVVSGTIRRA